MLKEAVMKEWMEKVRDTLDFLNDCNEDFEDTMEELADIHKDYVRYLEQLEALFAEKLGMT
jgi:predicted ribonuclease YlaK